MLEPELIWCSHIGAFQLYKSKCSKVQDIRNLILPSDSAISVSSNVNYSLFAPLTQFHGLPMNGIKLQGVPDESDNFYGFRYKEWTILYTKIDLIYFPLMSRSPLQKSLSLTHRRERSDGRERLKQRKIIWSYDMIHTIFRIDFKPTHMNQTYTICEISKQMVCGI